MIFRTGEHRAALGLTLLTAGLLAAPESAAQEAPASNDGIIVTATRTGGAAAPATTSITADDIDRQQPRSLLESLNDVAGVRAVSTGGPGGGSFVSIRGGEPNFTLVLVDGIRLNDPTNSKGGAFDFSGIDPALVERVTVSRDAGSAVHGSDALSGVIGIELREPKPGETELYGRVEAGTDEAVEAGFGGSAGWQGGGALLSGSWFDSGDKQAGSRLRRAQGLARVQQSIGSFDVRAIGLYAHTRHTSFPEDSGGPLFAVNRDLEQGSADLRVAGLSAVRSSGTVRPSLSLSYTEQRDDTATPAIAPGILDAVPALTARTLFTRFEAIADIRVESGIFTGATGASVRRETGKSDGTIDFGFLLPVSFALDRTIWSGFAEATLRPATGLTLNLAGHYDQVADGPHRWTGRAGIAWQPLAQGPSLYARVSDGFKLPSFYALGHPLVGNPNLRPETSRNVEAGLEWSWAGNTRLRLSWYENRFRDLIDFDPVLFTTVNRARVVARGIEGEASVRIGPMVVLSGALGHVVLDSATPLRGRPEWQGSAHAVWTVTPPLELNAALRFNSSFFDSSVPTGLVRTEGHIETDLGLRYRLSKRIGLTLALRNIGDSRYQDAVGWPAPGRSLDVGLSARVF